LSPSSRICRYSGVGASTTSSVTSGSISSGAKLSVSSEIISWFTSMVFSGVCTQQEVSQKVVQRNIRKDIVFMLIFTIYYIYIIFFPEFKSNQNFQYSLY
jgi:hypothetical protein